MLWLSFHQILRALTSVWFYLCQVWKDKVPTFWYVDKIVMWTHCYNHKSWFALRSISSFALKLNNLCGFIDFLRVKTKIHTSKNSQNSAKIFYKTYFWVSDCKKVNSELNLRWCSNVFLSELTLSDLIQILKGFTVLIFFFFFSSSMQSLLPWQRVGVECVTVNQRCYKWNSFSVTVLNYPSDKVYLFSRMSL